MNVDQALSLLNLTENGRTYTKKEIKAAYRKQINFYHPDKENGDVVMSQLINGAMEFLSGLDEAQYNETDNSLDLPKRALDALNKIKDLDGLIIEVIGMWIWVSGDTYTNREELGEAGFLYSKPKKSWFFNGSPKKVRIRSNKSMDDLRDTHGSMVVRNNHKKSIKQIAA